MAEDKSITRRQFIRAGARGAALLGLGGVAGYLTDRLGAGATGPAATARVRAPGLAPDDFPRTDPGLILYKEAGRILTGMRRTRGIAIGADDGVYVAGDGALSVFGSDGARLSTAVLSGPPLCLATTDDGIIYVGMKDHVEVYDRNWARRATWRGLGPRAVLTSISARGNDVFVADAGNRIVHRFDASGHLMGRIGRRDGPRGVPGFVVPSAFFDLAVAPDGLLRVANPGRHRVEAYTVDGDFEFSWGRASPDIDGFCGCCNPVNFALLPDGGMVTCEKGLPRVKVYDARGSFEGVVAGPELFAENRRVCTPDDCRTGGLDVAVDSKGRILVLDQVAGTVRIFART